MVLAPVIKSILNLFNLLLRTDRAECSVCLLQEAQVPTVRDSIFASRFFSLSRRSFCSSTASCASSSFLFALLLRFFTLSLCCSCKWTTYCICILLWHNHINTQCSQWKPFLSFRHFPHQRGATRRAPALAQWTIPGPAEAPLPSPLTASSAPGSLARVSRGKSVGKARGKVIILASLFPLIILIIFFFLSLSFSFSDT